MKKNYFLLIMAFCCLFSVTQKSYGQLSFNSTPVTTATVGAPYSYSAFAADGTSNAPVMTCPTLPSWMSFAATGSTSSVSFGPTIANPAGIAGDSDGNTYVASINGSFIYKIAPDGTANTSWAAVDSGTIYAMNVDGGYLYVSYYSNNFTGTSCIKKISLTNPGAGQAMVYNAGAQYGLLSLVFRGGYIYCANIDDNQILKIDPTTSAASVYVATDNPFGLGFNASGLLYIANYSNGTISTYDGTTLALVKSGLTSPSDVKIDSNGNVYVSSLNGGIKKYNALLTTEIILVPTGITNRIWGMNLTPTGSLIFGLNQQNTCARIGTGAVLSGTPALSDIGTHNVTIRATSATETVDQSFVVTVQGPPTLSGFPDLNGAVGTNLTLTDPTSNSAGAFTYTSSDPSIATISGNTVTPIAAGTTTITATQAASGNYTQETITSVLTVTTCAAPVAITKDIIVQLDAAGSGTLNAADVNNGSTGNCGISSYMFTTATTGSVCATMGEGGNLSIAAPTGSVFTGVTFASYGTPDGSCGSFTEGWCHASNSASVVSSYLIGQNTATIPATNSVFVDPCGGTPKRLYVEATYGPSVASFVASKVFSCADIGTQNVTLVVTDNSGNSAFANAVITVEDKVAPVIVTKNIMVQLDASGNATIAPADVDNGSADACGIDLLELDITSFTCANVGGNTVTLKATDVNGNIATQTAIVTVEDKVAPVLVTKSITVQLDATGNAIIAPADVDNGSADACGIDLLELDITSFTCANVGGNTVTLKATDVNGNVATQTAIVTVEDKVAPVIVTKSITVQLDATGNATIAPADIDNGSADACGIDLLELDITSFTCANVGGNTVTLKATDVNGNVATQTAIVTVEDKVAPVIVTKNIMVQLDATGNATIASADVDNGSADACGIDLLELDITSFTCANVGGNTVTLKATDVNGNVATQTAIVTVEDKVAPVIVTKSITVQLDATGNATIAPADVDNGSADACGIDLLELDITSFTCANVGGNTVTLKATDINGNVATQTAIVTVEDKVAPVVVTRNTTIQLNATGTASIVAGDINNGSTDACGISLLELDITSFTCANSGLNTVTLKVTDVNGNVTSKTAVVTVEDKIAPVVVTKNITIQLNTTGTASIVVADINNGSTDNCGISLLELDKTSFTCANIGLNTVTLKVTDNNGNITSKTAVVTIEDKVAPVVVTKNTTIQLNAAGTASIVVADVNNGSTDNCGISLVELDKMAFTCANVGANTVTLKVTDNNGNVAAKTAIITVEDKIAPVVITKNITVQLDASSNILIAAADVNNDSTDNCGISLLELDKTLFSCADAGENIVTLKVTDNSGNVTTRIAIVTIVNSQPNLIRKHFDDVIFFDNSSKAFIAYSWYKNGVLVSSQTTQYFKDSGVLNGIYYAKATKIDGTVITTCPLTFSASIVDEYLKIAPNPVKSNASYQILTNVDSAKLQNARITVFNILGALLDDKMVDGKTTDMIAPNTEGIYIVRMTLANGKYFTKNLLVKN